MTVIGGVEQSLVFVAATRQGMLMGVMLMSKLWGPSANVALCAWMCLFIDAYARMMNTYAYTMRR